MHCDLANLDKDSALSEILSNYCQHANGKYGINSSHASDTLLYCRENRSYPVIYEFYDSLELGDAVAILKSNSLLAALEVSRYINSMPAVRDTYTYCSIRRDILLGDSFLSEETKEDMVNDPVLAYATTRFSVKNIDQAETFFATHLGLSVDSDHNVFPKVYYITGTTDAIIDWGECSEEVFLENIRKIAKAGLEKQEQMPEGTVSIYDAFNDVITRVGMCYWDKKEFASAELEDKHESQKENSGCFAMAALRKGIKAVLNCAKKQNTVEPLQEEQLVPNEIIGAFLQQMNVQSDEDYPWKSAMVRLLGTVTTMSDNYVMDDLSNLLMPSVCALLKRITYLIEKKHWQEDYNTDIQEFLDSWTHLTNDITNLESQLVQHPELSAVRYYIPAMILQFEQEFVQKCSALLSITQVSFPTNGADRNRIFVPMLVPTQGRNVSTFCPLDPHHEEYSGACPLRIRIPLSMLYRPWVVSHALCHEIAHYCGDYVRHRTERMDCLCQCIATYIVCLWQKRINCNSPQNEQIEKMDLRFRRKLATEMKHDFCGNTNLYLSEIYQTLCVQMRNICGDELTYEEYQDIVLSHLSDQEKLFYIGQKSKKRNKLKQFDFETQLLNTHLKYIVSLCKECYADISMIILLDCTVEDYITCVFQDELIAQSVRIKKFLQTNKRNDLPPSKWYMDESVQLHIDRFALVYYTFCNLRSDGNTNWRNQKVSETDWVSEAKRRIGSLKKDSVEYWNSRFFTGQTLFISEVEELTRYLAICAKDMKISVSKKAVYNQVANLRSNLAAVKDSSFDWNKLQSFLRKK